MMCQAMELGVGREDAVPTAEWPASAPRTRDHSQAASREPGSQPLGRDVHQTTKEWMKERDASLLVWDAGGEEDEGATDVAEAMEQAEDQGQGGATPEVMYEFAKSWRMWDCIRKAQEMASSRGATSLNPREHPVPGQIPEECPGFVTWDMWSLMPAELQRYVLRMAAAPALFDAPGTAGATEEEVAAHIRQLHASGLKVPYVASWGLIALHHQVSRHWLEQSDHRPSIHAALASEVVTTTDTGREFRIGQFVHESVKAGTARLIQHYSRSCVIHQDLLAWAMRHPGGSLELR